MLRRELLWTGVKLRPMVLLLLALPLAIMLAVGARSSQGLPPPGDGTCLSKPPTLSVVNPSVVVNEGQVATNRGAYDDSMDPCEGDTVRISASVGTVTYPIHTEQGTWNWSYPAPEVSADQTRTVTIRATDTTGRYSTRSFSLTIRNLTTANDNFAQAQEISGVPGPGVDQWATVTGNSEKATTEPGEPLTPTWGTMFPWPFISGGHLSGIDCAVFSSYNSVWYKVTPQKDGWLYLSTEGSKFDTVLGLYEGASVGQLSVVDCSNENPNAPTSNWTDWTDELSAKVTPGKTYYVQLSGTGGARSGAYTLKTRLHFGPGFWPDATWRPFSSASPFNTPLSAYTHLKPYGSSPEDPLGDSPEIRSRIFSLQSEGGLAREGRPNHLTAKPSGLDGEPTYYSRPRDPDFTLHCEGDPFGEPNSTCPLQGMVIDIPAGAQVEGGPDRHLTVIDQATGLEYDLWQVKQVDPKGPAAKQNFTAAPSEGGDLYISYGGSESIYDDGLTSGRAATAAHFASTAGRIRAEELEAGHINHALFIGVECVNGRVWPATGNGLRCSEREKHNRGVNLPDLYAPPMGARLYLNMTKAQIDGLHLDPWKKTVLHALREYGAFIGDTGSEGYFATEVEAGVQYKVGGANDRWYSFGQNNWEFYTGGGVNEYVGKLYKDANDPGSGQPGYVDWNNQVWANMVVLDECVTKRTC